MNDPLASFLAVCRQAIQLNNRPIPYLKAFIAGLAAALPVLIGLLLNNFQNGLIASLGGLAFLYVFRMPYMHRVKKIIFIIIGLSLCAFLGSLLSTYPIIIAILMAVIVVVMVFSFGALNITGPSAIFMVLVFAMTSAMPATDFYGALLRSLLIASGGILSLFFGLMGWFFDPHKPEREILQRLYSQLNQLVGWVGTPEFKLKHADLIQQLNDTNQILQTSYIGWHQSEQFKKLFYLNKRANRIWLILGETFLNAQTPLTEETIQAFNTVNQSVQTLSTVQLNMQHYPAVEESLVEQLRRIEKIMNQSQLPKFEMAPIQLPTIQILIQSFNRHSIPLISASRFGIITLISALIAYSFEFPRSFWVPLSTVSVLSGVTILATLHRSLQRAFGTILGVCIATGLLFLQPGEYLIVFYIFFFCMMGEIFIVKNYGLTAIFFTPSALIIAVASTGMMDASVYFAEIRVMDVLIGTAIGLIGVFVINRHAASKYLNHSMAELIRAQSRLTYAIFKADSEERKQLQQLYFYPMKMRLNNLNILHQTMMGEIPKPQQLLEQNWKFLYELRQLSYLLERAVFSKKRQILSPSELADLLLIYEQMSIALELKQNIHKIKVPEISEFPLVTKQIERIQQAFVERDD